MKSVEAQGNEIPNQVKDHHPQLKTMPTPKNSANETNAANETRPCFS